jgi:N-formylglutamate amidohydrolase
MLPLVLSVPHAGTRVPPEVADLCILSEAQIIADGDEGAREIYDFASEVARYVTTDIGRALVDMNRAPEDFRADGVVKIHTCWNEPVYREFPSAPVIQALLDRYHAPYHADLDQEAPGALLGVDCHTMAAVAPPVGPDPGSERPPICLSNDRGTCPQATFGVLAGCFERAFSVPVSRNEPFAGGYIIRTHSRRLPWVQLELSRAPFATLAQKRTRVLAALRDFCDSAPAVGRD